MRTLVIWGAGRIGRGFVAPIFREENWRIVFVDVDRELVDLLNERGKYTIFRATVDGVRREVVEGGFTALHTSDADALNRLFLDESLLLDIAVHATELGRVASMLTPLIRLRAEKTPHAPLDILMNVNMSRPDEVFRDLLNQAFASDEGVLSYIDHSVGISGIAAACISPVAPDEMKQEDPLALINNNYPEQAVSIEAFRGELPRLPRLRLTENIAREETRKLYTLNMAHALLCYLGLPKGYRTVIEAMADPDLRALVDQALDEANHGLAARLSFTQEELAGWRDTVISLLLNPYIDDVLQRLGADTRRKLARHDRMVGPAEWCLDAGRKPHAIARAILKGFSYENDDEGPRAVRSLALSQPLTEVIRQVCGLENGHPLINIMINHTEEE